jgi:hypothetical protein
VLQNNFDIAKAKSDAALKVSNSTTSGLGAGFYKSAKVAYNQMKKELNELREKNKELVDAYIKNPSSSTFGQLP